MSPTQKLLDNFKSRVSSTQRKRALKIEESLSAGFPYSKFGGKKIRSSPSFIRFRLGRSIRLIWKYTTGEQKPISITNRQGFEQAIKRVRRAAKTKEKNHGKKDIAFR